MAVASSVYMKLRRALVGVGIVIRSSATAAISGEPTISSGTGAPSATEPNGSLYLRKNGTGTTTVYQRVGGNWSALPSGTDFGVAGLSTDAIAESTAAAGVTIDSTLLKDGGFRTADSSTAAFGADSDIRVIHATDSVTIDNNAGSGVAKFHDDVFNFVDPADTTKRGRLDAGAVTAGQTRVLAMANRDVDLDYAIQRAFVTIATADVKTLNAAPVQLVAAPGAGKFIEVESIHWWLDFNTTGYDAADVGDTLNAKYTNGAGAAVVDAVAGNAIGGAVADYHANVHAVPEVVPVENAAIVAHVAVGEWFAAAGDSPLKAEVLYRVRNFSPA